MSWCSFNLFSNNVHSYDEVHNLKEVLLLDGVLFVTGDKILRIPIADVNSFLVNFNDIPRAKKRYEYHNSFGNKQRKKE